MRLESEGVAASFDLDQGGRLASLCIDGAEMLVTDRTAGVYGWGCYPMVPWAGRVRRGRFRFDGAEVALPLGMPPHAIHGVALAQRWDHVGPGEIATDLADPWPFGGRVVQRADLTEDRLRLELRVRADRFPMPVVTGWHPWFRRDSAAGDPATLDFVADAMLVRDTEGIPTGATIDPPPGPWDDCFAGVRQPITLAWPDAPVLELRSSCRFWVVYTEPDHAICIEPQSGPPDAFNAAPDVVRPGEELVHHFEIRWRR